MNDQKTKTKKKRRSKQVQYGGREVVLATADAVESKRKHDVKDFIRPQLGNKTLVIAGHTKPVATEPAISSWKPIIKALTVLRDPSL